MPKCSSDEKLILGFSSPLMTGPKGNSEVKSRGTLRIGGKKLTVNKNKNIDPKKDFSWKGVPNKRKACLGKKVAGNF